MKHPFVILLVAVAGVLSIAPASRADSAAQAVLTRSLEHDPWGMSGASLHADIVLTDKRKATRTLSFDAVSQRIAPGLSKNLVRFSRPSELKGAGFLQVQNANADDDRFLFLPELRRSRRIAGNLRNTAFMGTDFSFADLDRRDLREGIATSTTDRNVGGMPCLGLEVTPNRKGSEYSRIEVCVGTENNLPLDMHMYDQSGSPLKAFIAQKVEKIDQRWFITRSTMTNLKYDHATQLSLSNIKLLSHVDDSKFSVRELERI
jgi:hypothetical protein